MSRFNRRMRDTASQLQSSVRDQATTLADQTRDGFAKGQKMMGTWEKSVEDSVRGNPTLYLGTAIALAALASLLAAGMLMRRK